MKISFSRLSPPGMDLSWQKRFFILASIGSVVYSFLFCIMYSAAYSNLFYYEGGVRIGIKVNAVMPPFHTIMGSSWYGFVFAAVCTLGFIIYNYAYYRQGSKSIYLMRRLPDKWEIHIRALALPVAEMLVFLISGLVIMLIYFAVYMLVTPDQCFAPEWQQIIWG